jgi:hypothetical protein
MELRQPLNCGLVSTYKNVVNPCHIIITTISFSQIPSASCPLSQHALPLPLLLRRLFHLQNTRLHQANSHAQSLEIRSNAFYSPEHARLARAPCAGREAAARYRAAMEPLLPLRAEVFFEGKVLTGVAAPKGKSWDTAMVVRYVVYLACSGHNWRCRCRRRGPQSVELRCC